MKKIKKTETTPRLLRVVGLGASSGGLNAFTEFLKKIPADTGAAFVLIQHLDPVHSSLLSEFLSNCTRMPTQEIKNGVRAKPNQVYVIPPGYDVGVLNGVFSLFKRDISNNKPHLAINFFFKALAADFKERAIGVVLTGTGSDGTEGLRIIKQNGGITLCQDPISSKYSEMPQSAVSAEVVDFCLSLPKLTLKIIQILNAPLMQESLTDSLIEVKDSGDWQKVFLLIRNLIGVDFSEYKLPTLKRRLLRRMSLMKLNSISAYIRVLQKNPDELRHLNADFLIHATGFFRDPKVFAKLKSSTFKEIIKNKKTGMPIRIWVTGCSTGEEVYSLAITLLEVLGDRASQYSIQVFGSDLSEAMIEKARAGVYSDAALRGVSAERLKRFFGKVDGGYRIQRLVRDLCVFVQHNLTSDPPFAKLDMVTCRNVLIYFQPSLQKKAISIFHYCLNPDGVLLLGHTESIAGQNQFFAVKDVENKIYRRVVSAQPTTSLSLRYSPLAKRPMQVDLLGQLTPVYDVTKQIDHLLLLQYAPAGVLINALGDVIQYRGKTGIFLEPPPGQPQLSLLKMLREGLFSEVKIALSQAAKNHTMIRREGVRFHYHHEVRVCNLIVVPIDSKRDSKEIFFLVLFEERGVELLDPKGKTVVQSSVRSSEASLRHELRTTQEYLQTLDEEHQRSSDSLNSINEELVSGNEELQSMNEELETAKEELQSSNEELTTVNDELHNKNLESSRINDDLVNLLSSVDIPIIILDIDSKIRRFTPNARNMMNLLNTDIGRNIDDIRPNFVIKDLKAKIQGVIQTGVTCENEVQDLKGQWHRLQIRPYETFDKKIAGVVLLLINIDLLRRAIINAEWVRDYANNIVEAVQIPLLVLNLKLEISSANQAFYQEFKTTAEKVVGQTLHTFRHGLLHEPKIQENIEKILRHKTSFQNAEMVCQCESTGRRVKSVSGRAVEAHDGSVMVLLAVEDITDRKNQEKERNELLESTLAARKEADRANHAKDLFLAVLSHELRTPLTSLLLQAQLLQRGVLDEAKVKKASQAIELAAKTQSQLIEDLLDVSRIVTGKLSIELVPVQLVDVIKSAVLTMSAISESKRIDVELNFTQQPVQVLGDPIRLQQVVWNLVNNAIKFTPSLETRGRVVVSMTTSLHHALIQVTDSGIGIEADFIPRVFSRFSQAESSSTRVHGGLGLGLAIVRHLVEMHRGTVKVESPGKNQGSTFTVSLPLLE